MRQGDEVGSDREERKACGCWDPRRYEVTRTWCTVKLRSTLNANGSWTSSVPSYSLRRGPSQCTHPVLSLSFTELFGAPQRSGPRMPFIHEHVRDLEGKGNHVKFRLSPLLIIWTTSEVRDQLPCDLHWKGTPNLLTTFLASPLRQQDSHK